MPIIVGVKFKSSPKSYYFDPNGVEFQVGDGVIVVSDLGMEYAKVTIANKEVTQDKIVGELKKILRKATEEDENRRLENIEKAKYAIQVCMQKAEKHKVAMKVTDAEYSFDRAKVVIYFTADGRVDFRELVKDLAGVLRTRIELRQIYERDDVKLKGSMGQCGRECCCIKFQTSPDKANVKMAKVQGISLNPQKTNGVCGKLMCCLKYENKYYEEVTKSMPKQGAYVQIPEGRGKVIRVDLLRQQYTVLVTKDDESQEMILVKVEDNNCDCCDKCDNAKDCNNCEIKNNKENIE